MNTQYIETLYNEYIELHTTPRNRDLLIQENNIEQRDIKGYHGREILELLQNADDAYQKSLEQNEQLESELNVEISYKNNLLVVANTGTFFDRDGIKAIVQGNNSPKKGKYIGNKGTGFRSILNWADKVSIYSGEFAVQFSKDIANSVFNEIKDKEQIKKQLKRNKSLYIPMLAVPKSIVHNRLKDRTTIEIEINPEKANDDYSVEKQLERIDLRILLFLPNISSININTEGSHIIYRRKIYNEQRVTGIHNFEIELTKTINNNIVCTEIFKLFRKDIPKSIIEDDIEKDIQLSIAIPLNEEITADHLYSYFPLLDTDSPFNCIFHATYSLGDHRNTINISDTNKRVIKEQLDFLIEIAHTYISKGLLNDAYRILLPTNYNSYNWNFPSAFAKIGMEDHYIESLSKLSMFKTVNNKLVAISDKPKRINCRFPNIFKGKAFDNILKEPDNENYKHILKLVSSKTGIDLSISATELCKAINKHSEKWEIAKQVEVFIWWNKIYRDCHILPRLLKTQKKSWLRLNEECYFLEGNFDSIKLPRWVKVRTLNEEYQKILVNYVKREYKISTNTIRTICKDNIFPLVTFKYKDRNNIIPTINSSIKDNYNRAIDFVKWLWKYYGQINEEIFTPSGVTLNFPTANGNVVPCNKLYFGSCYNNNISEKLFSFSTDFQKFPDAEIFEIEEKDINNFKLFILKFGILDFPKIEIQKLDSKSINEEYDILIKKEIFDTGVFEGTTTTHIDYCQYKLPYIAKLDNILKEAPMQHIIDWILNDHDLSVKLDSEYYSSEAEIWYHGDRQWIGNYTKYYDKARNYILAVFNNSPWIEIEGKHFAPKEVLNGFNAKNNQKFEKFIPVLTYRIVEKISRNSGIDINKIISVLSKFNFAKQITDLSSNAFYGLLLKLQESENPLDQELSKAIYRIVEQHSFTKDFENSDNRIKFDNEGKLLVRYNGFLQYWPAKKSYLPSTKIIIRKGIPIVEKGIRTNNRNFVRIFGCKEYKSKYTIVAGSERISLLNDKFQLYFRDFIKYARAYSERNDNIGSNIARLRVTLVSSIIIDEEGNKISINDSYTLINSTSTCWFIVFNDNDGEYDTNRLSEHIEDIFTNIANTTGFDTNKIGELFRTQERRNREFLIKKEFGSLSVIDDAQYCNEIKLNFINTLNTISPDCDIKNYPIDFDNFESITNSYYIIKLLKSINTDIDSFCKAGFVYPINIKEYLKSELGKFICNEKKRFKDVLFTMACNNEELQKEFIQRVNRFENYIYEANIVNSVNYNPIDELISEFKDWRTIKSYSDSLIVYNENYDNLNPDNKFKDEISNNFDVQRMIYFNKQEEFENWLKDKENHIAKQVKQNDEEIYSKYHSIIPQKELINHSDKTSRNHIDTEYQRLNNYHGTFSRQNSENKNRRLKQIGNIGELLIYNFLCNKYGREKVHPHSEAYVELGIIKPGQAISGEYDISYTDENNEEIYVEVKTGDRNTFFMSPGELNFAKRHSAYYYIYYVHNIDPQCPKFDILPTEFWKNDKFMIKEIVEKIEFKF